MEMVFRRVGDVWKITFAGSSCELRDARGLRYIAYLLQRPGEELHAIDLVNAIEGSAPRLSAAVQSSDVSTAIDLGDAGGGLDAVATGEYQRRLTDLRTELAEAEALNDLGRRARLGEELAFLSQELASAGRGRRNLSHAERARVAVTKAIRAAMTRIARAHPALGSHLDVSVRTGYFCSYTPDPFLRVRW